MDLPLPATMRLHPLAVQRGQLGIPVLPRPTKQHQQPCPLGCIWAVGRKAGKDAQRRFILGLPMKSLIQDILNGGWRERREGEGM